LIDALVSTTIAASNGEARRIISSGAISVNVQKISEDVKITEASLVKKGKNEFLLVR
jgi:tyrosyl-tRNA synthetase